MASKTIATCSLASRFTWIVGECQLIPGTHLRLKLVHILKITIVIHLPKDQPNCWLLPSLKLTVRHSSHPPFWYPLPLGWGAWVEAFCSYILGNGPQRALQNHFPFKTHQTPGVWLLYKITITNPLFLTHFHKEPTLQNDNPLNTSISLTFVPFDFDRGKTQSHFVEKTLGNPGILLDTSIGFWGCMEGMWWLDG